MSFLARHDELILLRYKKTGRYAERLSISFQNIKKERENIFSNSFFQGDRVLDIVINRFDFINVL